MNRQPAQRNIALPLALTLLFGGLLFWAFIFSGPQSQQPASSAVSFVPTATPVPREVALTRSGSGTMKTDLFALQGGNYAINWTARDTSAGKYGCLNTGSLHSSDAGNSRVEQVVWKEIMGTDKGDTNAYNMAPGKYYLDMISNCAWTVTV